MLFLQALQIIILYQAPYQLPLLRRHLPLLLQHNLKFTIQRRMPLSFQEHLHLMEITRSVVLSVVKEHTSPKLRVAIIRRMLPVQHR